MQGRQLVDKSANHAGSAQRQAAAAGKAGQGQLGSAPDSFRRDPTAGPASTGQCGGSHAAAPSTLLTCKGGLQHFLLERRFVLHRLLAAAARRPPGGGGAGLWGALRAGRHGRRRRRFGMGSCWSSNRYSGRRSGRRLVGWGRRRGWGVFHACVRTLPRRQEASEMGAAHAQGGERALARSRGRTIQATVSRAAQLVQRLGCKLIPTAPMVTSVGRWRDKKKCYSSQRCMARGHAVVRSAMP